MFYWRIIYFFQNFKIKDKSRSFVIEQNGLGGMKAVTAYYCLINIKSISIVKSWITCLHKNERSEKHQNDDYLII